MFSNAGDTLNAVPLILSILVAALGVGTAVGLWWHTRKRVTGSLARRVRVMTWVGIVTSGVAMIALFSSALPFILRQSQ